MTQSLEERKESKRLATLKWHKKNPRHHQEWLAKHPGYTKKHYAENKVAYAKVQRRKNYGKEAPEHYDRQLKKQKGKCAICQDEMVKPQIDHNHKTGKLRALLCKGCNIKVGVMESKLLPKVIRYLKKYGAETT
jgi:hypothetical protein